MRRGCSARPRLVVAHKLHYHRQRHRIALDQAELDAGPGPKVGEISGMGASRRRRRAASTKMVRTRSAVAGGSRTGDTTGSPAAPAGAWRAIAREDGLRPRRHGSALLQPLVSAGGCSPAAASKGVGRVR